MQRFLLLQKTVGVPAVKKTAEYKMITLYIYYGLPWFGELLFSNPSYQSSKTWNVSLWIEKLICENALRWAKDHPIIG